MKKLVSTELGGHPLTLKDVGFVQDAMYDAVKLQVISLVGTSPCILWGMKKTFSSNTTNTIFNVSAGAYWDGNEILKHQAATLLYPLNVFNPQVYLVINTNNSVLPPAVYKNGQTKYIYQEKIVVSINLAISTINLDAQPRLDDILKSRMGISGETGINAKLEKAMADILYLNDLSGISGGTDLNNFIQGWYRDWIDHIDGYGSYHHWNHIEGKPILGKYCANINNVPKATGIGASTPINVQFQDITINHNLTASGYVTGINYSAIMSIEHYDPNGYPISNFMGATAFMYSRAPNSCVFRVYFPNLITALSGVKGSLNIMITTR